MEYEFIKVDGNKAKEIHAVYSILKSCGKDMYEKQGLTHWKKPYSIEHIQNDLLNKEIYLVKDNILNRYAATFSITINPSPYYIDKNESKCIYVSKFATHPLYSKKGIGRQMMCFIEEICKNSKIEKIRLDVYENSVNAIRFYEKNGFQTLFSTKSKNFNVLCMEKTILGFKVL